MLTTKMEHKPAAGEARNEYLATQVSTASPVQLTMMLFDGADRYLQAAVSLLGPGMSVATTPVVTEAIGRGVAVVYQLMDTLDLDVWPEGSDLESLYSWIADELVQVNVAKRVVGPRSTAEERERNQELSARLDKARTMLAEVADAFRQARSELGS
jgi:flagellin-specific chaperone FliS